MENAIRTLKKLKLVTVFAILQLSLGILLLNNVVMQKSNVANRQEIFNKMFDRNNTYLVRVQQDIEELGLNSEHANGSERIYLKNICSEIYALKDKKDVKNVFSCYNNPIVLPELESIADKKYASLSNSINNEYDRHVCNLVIDENFFQKYSFRAENGRTFEKDDFYKDYKTENIPIMLGSDYEKDCKVGQTFDVKYKDYLDDGKEKNDFKFEVVGFIEDYSLVTFLDKEDEIFNNIRYSNSIVVIPNIDGIFKYSKAVSLADVGVFIELNNNEDISQFEENLKDIIKKVDPENNYKFTYSIVDLRNKIKNQNDFLKNDINVTLYLGITLAILSIIGITTTILGNLKQRKKEFGIKIASGATISVLCKELVYQTLIIVLSSAIIANICLYCKIEDYSINTTILLINIAFIAVFTLIISIVPILTLKKYDPIQLLMEEEK